MPHPVTEPPPSDEFVLLYFPKSESGWQIGFWSSEYEDWFESEASSKAMTAFGDAPIAWEWLPPKPKSA